MLNLNSNVIVNSNGSCPQLMDFKKGQFYTLNTIGYEMLTGVIENGIESTLLKMSEIYEVDPNCLKTDLDNLIQELVASGLIVQTFPNAGNKPSLGSLAQPIYLRVLTLTSWVTKLLINPSKTPNQITINLLLLLSWLSFRFLSWKTMLDLWQHWHPEPLNSDPEKTKQYIHIIDQKIRQNAAGSFFFPMVCKERALVGYHLLRVFYHLPVQLIIGTALYPLQVHAWVEYEGQIITDDPEHCDYFDPIFAYPDEMPLSPQPGQNSF